MPIAEPIPSIDRGNDGDGERWLNSTLSWLHTHYNGTANILRATWLRAMNDAAKKVTNPVRPVSTEAHIVMRVQNACEVLFDDIIESASMQPPTIDNVKSEMGPREHLTLICHVHVPELCVRLVSSQRLPDRLLVSNYDARIVDLDGEVRNNKRGFVCSNTISVAHALCMHCWRTVRHALLQWQTEYARFLAQHRRRRQNGKHTCAHATRNANYKKEATALTHAENQLCMHAS
jgi:hypothetical protein